MCPLAVQPRLDPHRRALLRSTASLPRRPAVPPSSSHCRDSASTGAPSSSRSGSPSQSTASKSPKKLKAGVKNCTESGESGPINNTKVNERLNTYYKALKTADPLHWKDRDLDPEIVYSSGGGMPHGRLVMGDGAIKKAVAVAKARENDIRPSNSISYHCVLKENADLKRRCKNNFVLSKHVQGFYGKLGWKVPEDLLAYQDELMDGADLMNEAPQVQEDGGTPLTDSSHVESHVDASTQMGDHDSAPAHDNHLGMP